MKQEIKNPWCTYDYGVGPAGIGRIVIEENSCVNIKYSEGQLFPAECWDSNYVKRFSTLEEATDHYIQNSLRSPGNFGWNNLTENQIREQVKRDFPSYFKEKQENN